MSLRSFHSLTRGVAGADGQRARHEAGLEARQPYLVALDLDRPAEELMADIRESVRAHGETGYVDPKFLEMQNINANG